MTKKQRYLITGGTGQVGHAIQQRLPVEAIGYVKARESLDITRRRQAAARIYALRPNAVINCAAYTNVRQAEQEQEQAWKVNALAVRDLAVSLAQEQIPLIHLSTDFVFGFGASVNSDPFRETDCIAPVGYYGWTKALGEHAIWQTAQEYPNWPFYIIRTAGVFELPWRQKQNFPWAVASRLARKQSVSIVQDVWTNIMAAEDLAKCLVYLADHHEKIPRGCYHITNQGRANWFEIANLIQREMTGTGRAKVVATTSEEFERSRGCDPAATAKYTCLSTQKFSKLPEQVAGLTKFPKLRNWQQAVQKWVAYWKELS